jgi:lysine 2,3-aminomutase
MASRTLLSVAALVAEGLVPPERATALERVAERYALAITPDVAALIDVDDAADPIARQFVPELAELEVAPEERGDPIGDERFSPIKGIVHRYPDRVLLKPLHVCPVYCRFCFRREQVGPGGEALTAKELQAALDYIRARPEIWEVIVTGGDPFLLSPRRLREIVRALDGIEHVRVIRFHTRVPAVDPTRVGAKLVAALKAETAVYVAIHANHPRELSPAFQAACRRLAKAGIPLLGQTVLLAGVNDDAAVLEELFRGLVAARVKPYYLHNPDLARGTRHFRPKLATGQALMRRLRGRVSGLCQPTYVLDLPGGAGKVPVGPSYAVAEGETWLVEDYQGRKHRYPHLEET